MAQQTFERRKLNEEIEETFLDAAKSASNIEMKLFSGRGNIVGDFQDFYNRFNYLVRLSSRLKEMEVKNDEDPIAIQKKKIAYWMQRKTASLPPAQIENVAREGLKLFDDYYHALMHQGIIALPTRKG